MPPPLRNPSLAPVHLAFLMLLSAVAATATAQTATAPFSAERMWGLDRLGEPTCRPMADGRRPVTRYDVAENKGLTDLWLVPDRRRPRPTGHQRPRSRHPARV